MIRGEVNAPRPDDQVILKADGFPTYHLAVVVDDHEMGITHVVRGEEWISSTPKHMLLYQLARPDRRRSSRTCRCCATTDQSKISKRKNPAARLTWFREQGYLPEALVNFLGLMGYSMPDEREVFTFDEMSAEFDWSRVNTVGPIFDLDKLNWLNGHYIRGADRRRPGRPHPRPAGARRLLPTEPTEQQREIVRAQRRWCRSGCSCCPRRRTCSASCSSPTTTSSSTDDARSSPDGRRRRRCSTRRVAALEALPEWATADHRGSAARGARRRPGAQAAARVRTRCGWRSPAGGVAAAVRVDGDPRPAVEPAAATAASGAARLSTRHCRRPPSGRTGAFVPLHGSPDGIRTRATALRGRRARPLHNGAIVTRAADRTC